MAKTDPRPAAPHLADAPIPEPDAPEWRTCELIAGDVVLFHADRQGSPFRVVRRQIIGYWQQTSDDRKIDGNTVVILTGSGTPDGRFVARGYVEDVDAMMADEYVDGSRISDMEQRLAARDALKQDV